MADFWKAVEDDFVHDTAQKIRDVAAEQVRMRQAAARIRWEPVESQVETRRVWRASRPVRSKKAEVIDLVFVDGVWQEPAQGSENGDS